MTPADPVTDLLARATDPGWQRTLDAEPLADPAFREAVYRGVHDAYADARCTSRRPLLLAMLDLEVAYRAAEVEFDHFENLYRCAFLLSRLGVLDDVLPLWRAKQTNFDTAVGFDAQLLVGAGVQPTLDWLAGQGSAEASQLRTYLQGCVDAGDFEDLREWAHQAERYLWG